MEIRLRHCDDARAVPFTTGDIDDVDRLIKWIDMSGGVYCEGHHYTGCCYQIVQDESGAYVEIIYGSE